MYKVKGIEMEKRERGRGRNLYLLSILFVLGFELEILYKLFYVIILINLRDSYYYFNFR